MYIMCVATGAGGWQMQDSVPEWICTKYNIIQQYMRTLHPWLYHMHPTHIIYLVHIVCVAIDII